MNKSLNDFVARFTVKDDYQGLYMHFENLEAAQEFYNECAEEYKSEGFENLDGLYIVKN